MLTLITTEPAHFETLRPGQPELAAGPSGTTLANAPSNVVDITLLRRRRIDLDLEPQGGDAA